MANRMMDGGIRSFTKERCFVDLRVAVGAAGALTLDGINSEGILSITRNSAGNWTVQFGYIGNTNVTETYNRLLAMSWYSTTTTVGANTPSTVERVAVASNTINTNGQVVLLLTGPTAAGNTAQVAVDPANGETFHVSFQAKNSDAT